MNVVFLGLGGNIGNRLENLEKMRQALNASCGGIVKASGIYETEAWGSDSQNNYLNQVVKLKTALNPGELLTRMLAIEETLERVRSTQNADRTADLDILFYNDLIIHSAHMQIPHPRLHLRKFALVPLTELEPELIHPELKQTMKELLTLCDDPLKVELVQVFEN